MENMQWTLFLLILIGQCSLFTCHLYQYHFIKEKKTWDEAQKFCRENYTDLATVSNMTDMERLCNSAENQDEAWIGLHSYPGAGNNTWHWSVPGLEFNGSQTRWGTGEPDKNGGFVENCIQLDNQQWLSWRCSHTFTFICYSETKQSNNTFHFINTMLTWPQAQSYCRQHYTDLVSGLDQLDDPTVKSISKVWMGLFRDTWKWSDGSNFTFRNWEYVVDLVDGQSDKTCATVLNTAGKWSSDYCDQQKPFYCYDESAEMNKHVVRLKLSAPSSVDITDRVVTESMLEQIEEKFKARGLSVKLSWRKPPEKQNPREEESEQECSP